MSSNKLKTSVTNIKLEKKPIPLLVVLISFKPKGAKTWEDGIQMISTTKEHWYNVCFGDEGYTLKNFYKEMSGGKIYFEPVHVMGETKTPGVLEVVLDMPHPHRMNEDMPGKNHGVAFKCIAEALRAADEYVDFAYYDKDGGGYLSGDEFNVLLIHAGYDGLSGIKRCKGVHWGVYANCGSLPEFENEDDVEGARAPVLDGVKLCARGKGCYTLIGEYRMTEGDFYPHALGTIAHELGHSIGFHDVYDYDREVKGWPLPYLFSLMGHGNYGNDESDNIYRRGFVPQHLDPFQKIRSGIMEPDVVSEDGEYTVHPLSAENANIIKITTPDPKEYFLLENRQMTGFCKGIYRKTYGVNERGEDCHFCENYKEGGIIVWHIDEDIFDTFSVIKRTNGSGTWLPDGETEGTERHDPGIVALFKDGFDENGLLKDDGVFVPGYPEDPFYRKGEVFNSNEFVSAATHTKSLNSFPEGYSQDTYNLKIEFVDFDEATGDIKIRVTQKTK